MHGLVGIGVFIALISVFAHVIFFLCVELPLAILSLVDDTLTAIRGAADKAGSKQYNPWAVAFLGVVFATLPLGISWYAPMYGYNGVQIGGFLTLVILGICAFTLVAAIQRTVAMIVMGSERPWLDRGLGLTLVAAAVVLGLLMVLEPHQMGWYTLWLMPWDYFRDEVYYVPWTQLRPIYMAVALVIAMEINLGRGKTR